MMAAVLFLCIGVVSSMSIFDDEHDFMKGFETGVMIRSRGKKLEDFGCLLPPEAIDRISPAL